MTISSCLRRNSVVCTLTIVGIMWVTSGLWAQKKVPAPPPPPEFAEANAALKSLEDVGPKLIQILADENRPNSVRVQAAIWLGKLRYTPAIPTLIRYITMEMPNQVTSDGPEYPCSDALELFGDAAVPALVDAYLKADNDRLELCLFTAISRKSQPAARTYAKGLAVQNPDPMFQVRVKRLLDDIKPDVPR